MECEEHNQFEDGNMVQNTIIRNIIARDNEKGKTNRSTAVEHSHVDFQHLIVN